MLVCAPYYYYLLYPIYPRWDLLYSGTTMELPKNIPITSQWDFSYSGSELRGKDSPSRSPDNAAPQMGYSALKNKCESNSVVGISPTRRNSLQVTQMEFQPLGSRDILLPHHSRALPEQNSGELINAPRGQPVPNKPTIQQVQQFNKFNSGKIKMILFIYINSYISIAIPSNIVIISYKQIQNHIIFCKLWKRNTNTSSASSVHDNIQETTSKQTIHHSRRLVILRTPRKTSRHALSYILKLARQR